MFFIITTSMLHDIMRGNTVWYEELEKIGKHMNCALLLNM